MIGSCLLWICCRFRGSRAEVFGAATAERNLLEQQTETLELERLAFQSSAFTRERSALGLFIRFFSAWKLLWGNLLVQTAARCDYRLGAQLLFLPFHGCFSSVFRGRPQSQVSEQTLGSPEQHRPDVSGNASFSSWKLHIKAGLTCSFCW